MLTKRQLWYISGLLVFLALAILVQQYIAIKAFFQLSQVLHHETVAIFLVALTLGILIGSERSD